MTIPYSDHESGKPYITNFNTAARIYNSLQKRETVLQYYVLYCAEKA